MQYAKMEKSMDIVSTPTISTIKIQRLDIVSFLVYFPRTVRALTDLREFTYFDFKRILLDLWQNSLSANKKSPFYNVVIALIGTKLDICSTLNISSG